MSGSPTIAARLAEAHFANLLQQPSVILVFFLCALIPHRSGRKNRLASVVSLGNLFFLRGRPGPLWMCCQDHIQQRCHGGIRSCATHGSTAGWACKGRPARPLGGEPFFQAGAAEGVQAVEEGQRLVEKLGTDLGGQRENESV